MGLRQHGLNLLGVNAYWQKVALGVVIIAAVLFDSSRVKISRPNINFMALAPWQYNESVEEGEVFL